MSPDGQRFLMFKPDSADGDAGNDSAEIIVVEHWLEAAAPPSGATPYLSRATRWMRVLERTCIEVAPEQGAAWALCGVSFRSQAAERQF